jgi:hypothetical protein
VIERLLAAEAALDRGDVDTAGIVFTQVAQADPKNVIAIVGLARVALREDRIQDARDLATEALELDPNEAAAQKILREVLAEVPPEAAPERVPAAAPQAVADPAVEPVVEPVAEAEAQALPTPTRPAPAAPRPAAGRPSLLARLRRWLLGPRN